MPKNKKIFLDITTMLAYISDLCNGGCNDTFNEAVLSKQATDERELPALTAVTPFLSDRKLMTCQSALDDFWSIVNIMAGKGEKRRAQLLTDQLVVVPDCISNRFTTLITSGQIKDRSKVIFGTADMVRSEILTSNERFIRAAAAQNIHISANLHQPRALSEKKKLTSVSLSK